MGANVIQPQRKERAIYCRAACQLITHMVKTRLNHSSVIT